jgi:hypothetical protein
MLGPYQPGLPGRLGGALSARNGRTLPLPCEEEAQSFGPVSWASPVALFGKIPSLRVRCA